MELNELRFLVKVVQLGSFTKAADALGLQKAHVSRVITQLEQKLAVRLLERTTRSLSLTEIGREVYERAVVILNTVDETRQITQQSLGAPQGLLRLTCGVEFGLLVVSDWIHAYLVRYPDVKIEAEWTGRLVDIVHEGFDLAIRVGHLADSSLVARYLGELHYGLFASPDYVAQYGAPTTAEALNHHTRLTFSATQEHQIWELTKAQKITRIRTPARLAINNYLALQSATLAGLGIAQLPLKLAHQPAHMDKLITILPDWQLPSVPIHAVFASSRYLTPKVRTFIDYAAQNL